MPSIRFRQTSKGLAVSAVCSSVVQGKPVQKVVQLGLVANKTEGHKRANAFCRNFSSEQFKKTILSSRPNCPTLAEYIPRYLREAEGTRLNSRQGLNVPINTAKHLLRILGHLKLTELLPAQVDAYVTQRKKEPIKHCKVPDYRKLPSPKTINNELIMLSGVLQFAVERDVVEEHPFKTPKRKLSSYFLKTEKRPHDYFTAEDKVALLKASEGQPYAQVVMQFLWWTGLRQSELSQLKWDHVDLEARNIQIFADKTSDTRTIPIPDALFPLVQKLKTHRATRIAWVPRAPHQCTYVFCHTDGKAIAEPGKFLPDMAMKAGISKKSTPHTCRHSFITELRNSGLGPWELMSLTGHKNVATLEGYGANVPKGVREKVNGAFGEGSLDPGLTQSVLAEQKVIEIKEYREEKWCRRSDLNRHVVAHDRF
jgi:integrase